MITISRLRKVEPTSSLRAFVDIIIDGQISLLGIRLIEVEGKLLVKLPDKKTEKGEWIETIKILDVSLWREIEEKIIYEYNLS